jgi:signal transduction histidine kinase
MERDAERLSRIVSDLLDLSRLEAGSDERTDVELDDVVREETRRLGDLAAARDVRLSVETDGATVRGSGRDLALLVRNLVENAIHYSKPGGEVSVSVRRDDGAAVVRVADTGIGIPRRDLPRIFERFYRVDQARSRATGGTGLGLAIVKHVAENHGGNVSVESELGEGSVFEVRLPA